MSEYSEDEKLVIRELKKYVRPQEHELNNWGVILERVEHIEPNIYKYKLYNMELYFDDEMILVEYGNVHIINGKAYYDYGYNNNGSGTYEYIGDVNNA